MRSAAAKYGEQAPRFVSLYRFDFLVDEGLRRWLAEVNQSPNLSAAHTPGLKPMFDRLTWSFVSLLGLRPGALNHPHTPDDDTVAVPTPMVDIGWDVCGACPAERCGEDAACVLCRRCRTPQLTRQLKQLVSEERNREGFRRLLPAGPRREGLVARPSDTRANELMRSWLAARCPDDPAWC